MSESKVVNIFTTDIPDIEIRETETVFGPSHKDEVREVFFNAYRGENYIGEFDTVRDALDRVSREYEIDTERLEAPLREMLRELAQRRAEIAQQVEDIKALEARIKDYALWNSVFIGDAEAELEVAPRDGYERVSYKAEVVDTAVEMLPKKYQAPFRKARKVSSVKGGASIRKYSA